MATSMGTGFASLLRTVGLSSDKLVDPDLGIDDRILPKMLKVLVSTYRADHAPFALAKAMPSSIHGPAHQIIVASPDLATALAIKVDSAPLFSKSLELELIYEDTEVLLRFHHPADKLDAGLGAEFGLGLSAMATHQYFPSAFKRVQFSHTPNTTQERYDKFFGVPVSFGAPFNALVVSRDALTLNTTCAEVLPKNVLEHRLRILLRQAGHGTTDRVSEVREAVNVAASRGQFTVAEVAQTPGISVRSLQRLLKNEGLVATEPIDEARHHVAGDLLSNPRLSIEEVAEQVGFDSERGFRKAYERWAGKSPSRDRKERVELRGQGGLLQPTFAPQNYHSLS